jgi:hypothetical protein
MFTDLYTLDEGKSGCGGLLAADAAIPLKVLFSVESINAHFYQSYLVN